MKTLVLICCVTLGLSIASCQDKGSVVETKYPNQFLIDVPASEIPYFVTMPKDFVASAYELRKMEEYYQSLGINDLMLLKTRTWQEVDAHYRKVLAQNQQHPYLNCLRQVLAQNMLMYKGLLDLPTKEVKEAVLFYTNELVKAGSANTPLVYASLVKLRGNINSSTQRELGQKTLLSYEELSERQKALATQRTEDVKKFNAAEMRLYNKIMAEKQKAEKAQALYAQKLS